MATIKLSGKELRAIGYPEGRIIATIMNVMEEEYKGKSKRFKLELLSRVLASPALYVKHQQLGPIAKGLIIKKEHCESIELNKHRKEYNVYGLEGIEPGAINQMEIAMKLPITNSGALMPDAHQGYGLPIGGVLATNNAVIPYGVGVDIGCRMCLSIFDVSAGYVHNHVDSLQKMLLDHSKFGNEVFKRPKDHEVLGRKEFDEINILKSLKDRAYSQIGTSGGGNHFVEFGVVEVLNDDLGVPKGKYLSLLTHSGSRGLGANVARHYTKLAMDKCILPSQAKHLAWLDLDTEDGQEYWQAMSLAGDYASACHHQIHERIAQAFGEQHLLKVENHHNFAWKEQDTGGNEIIVHRKGATPALEGVLGIIPGSMTSPGFIVRGKGNGDAINSASHGAGRVMSRTKAKQTLSKREVQKHLKAASIHLIGSGIDEAPMVYKDIHKVMAYQTDLVDILGQFTPKMVRMCGDKRFMEVD